jgi:FlaA1/EpsC-like NDP-sugar epimerase
VRGPFRDKRSQDTDDVTFQPESFPGKIVARVKRDMPLVLLDLACVLAAYLGSLVLRFDGSVPVPYWDNFWTLIPVITIVHLLANQIFGLYGRMWRYASVLEARKVLLAGASGGAVLALVTIVLGGRLRLLPLSVVIVGAGLSVMGFGAIRFESRLFAFRRRTVLSERSRVLLVGAGDAGNMILKDLLHNPSLGLDPVGIIDDDPRKHQLVMHGVPIVGDRTATRSMIERHEVDQVLLAIPSATSDLVRDVAATCEETDVSLRVVPSVKESLSARVTARDIRDLKIEDLLGRQQVDIDLDAVAAMVRGKRVLVTGAGGSIGSEIARQVVQLSPEALFLLDHDETHLHEVLTEIDGRYEVQSLLADIRDRIPILEIFMRHRPEIVFHAAAHKHVPLLETHPDEAMFTNVVGTANVADAAVTAGSEQFVLISTDKAVRPASVMGASKWFAEQLVWSLQNNGCRFSAVRFGNVLGSRGSVIPTFLRQIHMGGPVTVTDPSMTRYFMSVQESVQLVLQAATLSKGGEVFTLDMGEPVNILELAKGVIRLSGLIPDKDVDVAIVGARPGEKIVEDVVNADEEPLASSHPAIVVSRARPPDRVALRHAFRELQALAAEGLTEQLGTELKQLPERDLQEIEAGVAS